MRHLLCTAVAMAIIAAGPATAGEVQFKPIDTKKLVVQPSKAVANLTAGTIDLAGKTAASQIESDGFVKTINNVLGFRKTIPTPTQPGRSPLPAPRLYQSTQYKNFNQPMMPIAAPARRR